MTITNGRLESELKDLNKIHRKLNTMPKVVRNYFYHLEAADKSYTTIKVYINYLSNFIEYITNGNNNEDFYKNITSANINEYMSSLRYKTDENGNIVKNGNSIRATRWSALNTFFIYLKSNQLIDNNPMDQTIRPSCKQNRNVTFLETDEIKQCINEIENIATKQFKNRDLCLFQIGVSVGLRVSAISQIDINDIDLKNNTIKVVEKGNKHRTMFFGANFKRTLLAWIDDRNEYFPDVTTNALFISRKKNRMSVSAIEDVITKYTKKLDKHITPHKLRATCATNLYKQTGDIYMVAEQLGHSNIATSKIYTEIGHETKLKATNILDSLI